MIILLASSVSVEQFLVLNLSPLMLGVVCILCPVILSYAGLILTRKMIPSKFLRQHHDVTGPFFCTLGTVYGIFLAFIVATTWQYYSSTGSNVVQEARCLDDLYTNSKAFSPTFGVKIQELIRDYRDALVSDGWKSLQRGKVNPESNQLLFQIRDSFVNYKITDASEGAFFLDTVKSLNQMLALRASRIDDASSGLIPFLWCVLLAGGLATIGFSFLFGGENIHIQAVMTMLLTGVIALTLYTIVNLDFPFTGLVAISPEPFQKLQLK